MIEARTAALLRVLVRREGRTLLQYVADALPWTRNAEHETLHQLQTLIEEDRDANSAVARFLLRNRVAPPYLGPYPMGFTSLNFVSLSNLIPRLINEQRRSVSALKSDLAQIHEPQSRGVIEGFLEVKRRHLKALEAMLPAAAAAPTSA
jgi:hypothetical protein